MSGVDLGSVINLIMQNPELLANIKKLAEEVPDGEVSAIPKNTEQKEMPVSVPEKKEEERVDAPASQPVSRPRHTAGKRSELLHALSPYISEGRQKALESFMTIADILELMREK